MGSLFAEPEDPERYRQLNQRESGGAAWRASAQIDEGACPATRRGETRTSPASLWGSIPVSHQV